MSYPIAAELRLRPGLPTLDLPTDRVLVSREDHWRAWRARGPEGASLAALVLALREHASDSGFCWPSKETLADYCRVGVRQVRAKLADASHLRWVHRVSAGYGSRLTLFSVPLEVAEDLGIESIDPGSLLSDLRDRRGWVPARVCDSIRELAKLLGERGAGQGGHIIREGDDMNRAGGSYHPPEPELTRDEDEEEEERPHAGVNRIRDHLPVEDSFSSISLSRSQEKSPDEGPEHRELRAELRGLMPRVKSNSRGFAQGLVNASSWSPRQAESARSLIEQARSAPPPEVTESDRIEYRGRVAAELRLLGVDKLDYASPIGVVTRLEVESWKHTKRYLNGLSRGVSSKQRAREIANSLTPSRKEMYAGLDGKVSG